MFNSVCPDMPRTHITEETIRKLGNEQKLTITNTKQMSIIWCLYLGHDIPEIRERALKSIDAKLSQEDFVAKPHNKTLLFKNLLRWFGLKPRSPPESALALLLRLFEVSSFKNRCQNHDDVPIMKICSCRAPIFSKILLFWAVRKSLKTYKKSRESWAAPMPSPNCSVSERWCNHRPHQPLLPAMYHQATFRRHQTYPPSIWRRLLPIANWMPTNCNKPLVSATKLPGSSTP